VAYFPPLKNTAHHTTFSPQITTQKPQIHHHKTPTFPKNPQQNRKKIPPKKIVETTIQSIRPPGR